jgi:hypothetical protein
MEAVIGRQLIEDRIGTCPRCWGQFKVRDDNQDGRWSLVLHGYERPGHGHVVGRCAGTDQQPLEHSPDGLKPAIADLRKELAETAEGTERWTVLDVRLRFAEAELVNWRRAPIPGIDIVPVPFTPRRPPTPEELAERLKRGLGLRDNLERARLAEYRQALAERPPRLVVTVTVPDPWHGALDAERIAVEALKVKGFHLHLEDIPRHRAYVEAVLPLRVAESRLEIDRDRYRLALGRTVGAWAKGHDFAVIRPETHHGKGVFTAKVEWRTTTWEVLEAVGLLLEGVATRQGGRQTVGWRIDAGDLAEVADALGVDAVDPAKVCSTIKPEQLPPFPTWESLSGWDGSDGLVMHRALKRFFAMPSEVEWLWRVPPHLEPFAQWGTMRAACDDNGNVITCPDYPDEDHLRRHGDLDDYWRMDPIDRLSDYGPTIEALGLTRDQLGILGEAGVTALSAEGMAFIPQVTKDKESGRQWYGGHVIRPIADVLADGPVTAAAGRAHPGRRSKRS